MNGRLWNKRQAPACAAFRPQSQKVAPVVRSPRFAIQLGAQNWQRRTCFCKLVVRPAVSNCAFLVLVSISYASQVLHVLSTRIRVRGHTFSSVELLGSKIRHQPPRSAGHCAHDPIANRSSSSGTDSLVVRSGRSSGRSGRGGDWGGSRGGRARGGCGSSSGRGGGHSMTTMHAARQVGSHTRVPQARCTHICS